MTKSLWRLLQGSLRDFTPSRFLLPGFRSRPSIANGLLREIKPADPASTANSHTKPFAYSAGAKAGQ